MAIVASKKDEKDVKSRYTIEVPEGFHEIALDIILFIYYYF